MESFVVGQPRVERALAQALGSGRLAHGLLFSGPSGVGRERAALGLAAGLVCTDAMQDGRSLPWGCGQCRACRRARAAQHPDVHVLMSEAEAVRRGLQAADKKRRPSADILVDAVRELTARLRMASYEGGARVAIIVDAHRMTTSAQNALLKTLEEPASATWLVLIVPHERMVLPTIASRCLRLTFAPLAETDVASILRQTHPADADVRARMAGGSVERALEFDPSAAHGPGESLLRALLDGSAADRLDAAESLGKERSDVDAALADVELKLASLMRTDVATGTGPLDWRSCRGLLESVHSARRAIAHNASVQLCLEALLLRANATHV